MEQMVFQSSFREWRVSSAAPPEDLEPCVAEFWETQGVAGYGYEKLIPRGTADAAQR